jgi:phospholipase C
MSAKFIRPWKAKLGVLAASTIFSAAAAMPSFAGDEGKQPPSTQTPIKHVVVIYGENISFDHYFGLIRSPRTRKANRGLLQATTRHRPTRCSQPGF